MKKVAKTLLSIAAASMLCLSGGLLVACDETEVVEGKSAYEIAVENGFVGTEQEWLDSLVTEGKSAYDIAVENGFEGTEQEWLNSLKLTVTDTDVTYSTDANGYTVANITLTMSDGSTVPQHVTMPRRVVSAHVGGNPIWTTSEATAKSNLTGLVWNVIYDDGSEGALPVGKSQITEVAPYYNGNPDGQPAWDGNFQSGKVYHVEFCFGAHWYETSATYIYVCDDLTTLDAQKAPGGYSLRCPDRSYRVNETIDANTLSLSQRYELKEVLQAAYDNQYNDNGIFYKYIAVTGAMIGAVDTSTVGYKDIIVTYNDTEYEGYFGVYDPSVTIVQNMMLKDTPQIRDFTITQGDDVDTTVLDFLIDKKLYVNYWECVNGTRSETTTITEGMVSHNIVNDTPGDYNVTVTYKGYAWKLPVRVMPDMSTATLSETLTNSGAKTVFDLFMVDIGRIELYDNGYAMIFGSSGQNQAEYMGCCPSYTLTADTLELKNGSEKLFIFAVNTVDGSNEGSQEKTISTYTFTGDPIKTYTGEVPVGMAETLTPATIKTYSNGYGQMIVGEGAGAQTIVAGYTIEGSTMTIAPENMGITLILGADDTFTLDL